LYKNFCLVERSEERLMRLRKISVFTKCSLVQASSGIRQTEKIVRLGLPKIIRLKENAPELDSSSFYGKTGTGSTNCFVMEVERSF
jgi:hypothetical protein